MPDQPKSMRRVSDRKRLILQPPRFGTDEAEERDHRDWAEEEELTSPYAVRSNPSQEELIQIYEPYKCK